MSILLLVSWLVFGFIVGIVARLIYPGAQSMGLLGTALLGIVGSMVGGLLGNLVVGAPLLAIHGAGIVGSIVGSLIVLGILRFSTERTVAL
jgi:uncharacterized membrane protein YeaQ/YmgE (transglycosylase-associated protein family)